MSIKFVLHLVVFILALHFFLSGLMTAATIDRVHPAPKESIFILHYDTRHEKTNLKVFVVVAAIQNPEGNCCHETWEKKEQKTHNARCEINLINI